MPARSGPKPPSAVAEDRRRLRSRGPQRVEVEVRGKDAPLVREVAPAFADHDQAGGARALLRLRFRPGPRYREEARALPNLNATSVVRGTMDPQVRKRGAAEALGRLLPPDAVCMYREHGLRGERCCEATCQAPRFGEGGFSSLTLSCPDKAAHEETCSLNNRAIRTNPDGAFTLRYGPRAACGEATNRLNALGDNGRLGMRVDRPAAYVVEGRCGLPVPAPVSAR
jgi:hypothetical protein